MKKITNPEIFISRNKTEYFEGWYFKNVFEKEEFSFAVIPGICKNKTEEFAFIQVIHSQYGTYHVTFPMTEFSYQDDPFDVKIDKNYFSKQRLLLDIQTEELQLQAHLSFKNLVPIKKNIYAPNMMGPFAYIPGLECIHGVLSLSHGVVGDITFQGDRYLQCEGVGYIEKDAGTSFPKQYMWCECNTFPSRNSNVFFAIATVPIGKMEIMGHICSFKLKEIEYRFATYTGSKVSYHKNGEKEFVVTFKSNRYRLEVRILVDKLEVLKAPSKSCMNRDILESLSSQVEIHFYDRETLIYSEQGTYGAVEIVNIS